MSVRDSDRRQEVAGASKCKHEKAASAGTKKLQMQAVVQFSLPFFAMTPQINMSINVNSQLSRKERSKFDLVVKQQKYARP